jgi:lipoprotein-anchoring transpeptidase ErfK/SrfK
MRRTLLYRLTLLAALALFAMPWAGPASARIAAGKARHIAVTQRLAALLSTHTAFSKPDVGSKRLGKVQPVRPITAEQTVLPVLGVDATGQWLKVRLPGRPEVPHAHTGWINSQDTVTHTTNWHLVVRTATRRVVVYHSGHLVKSFLAIVGKPSTPTPHGEFFVEESIKLKPTDIGAPFALALSARSPAFQEFLGGPGQVALHGLDNVGGVLGTAVSHGCVRLADTSMRWLVSRVGPGVPVTITS